MLIFKLCLRQPKIKIFRINTLLKINFKYLTIYYRFGAHTISCLGAAAPLLKQERGWVVTDRDNWPRTSIAERRLLTCWGRSGQVRHAGEGRDGQSAGSRGGRPATWCACAAAASA